MTLLVLLSAFLDALWNVLIKREKETDPVTVAVLGVAAISAVLAALPGGLHLSGRAAAFGVLAGFCEGAYFVTLARALERGPLSTAYPISRRTAILIVWPLSAALFGERVALLGGAGALLVLVGLFATGSAPASGPARPIPRAILCGLCIASYHLAYKTALAAGARPMVLIALSLATALALNLLRLGGPGRRRLASVISSRALPLVVASVVFALLLALFIGERPGRLQVVGALLISAGAILAGLPR